MTTPQRMPGQLPLLASIAQLEQSITSDIVGKHADLVSLMTEITETMIEGMELCGGVPIPDGAPQWVARYNTHMIATLLAAHNLLLKGYYTQALSLLRLVVEDASIAMYLSIHPEDAELFEQAERAVDSATDSQPIDPEKIKASALRAKLQKEGKAADAPPEISKWVEFLDQVRDVVKVLNTHSHSSLYAIRFVEEAAGGLSMTGFYDADRVRLAAYYYIGAAYLASEAVRSLAAPRSNQWDARMLSRQKGCRIMLASLQLELQAELAALAQAAEAEEDLVATDVEVGGHAEGTSEVF